MTRAAVGLGLTLAIVSIGGCTGHGAYSQALLDEAEGDMRKMRAAMEYDSAVQHFESGEIAMALSSAERSVALAPDNAKGHLLRGRILLEQGQAQTAQDALDRGQDLDATDPLIPYYRGIALERLGRLEDALGAFARASALDRGNACYRLAVAETGVELDRLAEARTVLVEARDRFGSNPAFPHMLGHVAMLEDRPGEAVGFLTDAALLRPDDPVIREDLACAQIAAGRLAEAESNLRRLVEAGLAADRTDLRHLHAACLIQLDRPIEARGVLFEIIQADDGAGAVEAWVRLIDVVLMLNDDDLLQTAAYRLMSLAPSRHEGYLAMALWQRRDGDLEGALRSTERAIKRAVDDPTPRNLQSLLRRQLQAGDAPGWFERSVAASGRTLALVRPRRSVRRGPDRAHVAALEWMFWTVSEAC